MAKATNKNNNLLAEYDPKELNTANKGVPIVARNQEVYVPVVRKAAQIFDNSEDTGGRRGDSLAVGVGGTSPVQQAINIVSDFIPSGTSASSEGSRRATQTPLTNQLAGEKNYVPEVPFANNLLPKGQPVINNPASAAWANYNNPAVQNAFRTPTSSTRLISQPSGFQTPTTNGFTSQIGQPPSQQQTPLQQMLVQNQRLVLSNGTVAPQKPSGMYDPSAANAQQWRDYWTWQSQNPDLAREAIQAEALAKGKPDPFAPTVMTAQQIWNMKANQRRASMEEMQSYDYSRGGYTPTEYYQEPAPFWNYGNAVTAASWRIG